MQLVTTSDRTDADVIRLDITVRNALLFQILDNIQQVLSEALQELQLQFVFLSQPLAERFYSGAFHQDACLLSDSPSLDVFNEVLVAEFAENLTLALEAVVMGGINCCLEHELLAIAFN